MNLLTKFFVISIVCILTLIGPVYGQPAPVTPTPVPTPAPPSNSYIPQPSEYTSHFTKAVADIAQALTAKDNGQLKKVSAELLSREESNNTRGDDDEKYFLSGFAKRNAGDIEGAVTDFQKSLEFRQSNPHAHFLLAQSLADLGKCEAALPELDQVRFLLGAEPASGYLLRAQCLSKLDRQPEADTLITAGRKVYFSDIAIKKLSLSFKAKAMAQGAILDDAQTAELEGDLVDLAAANPDDSNIQLMYGKSLLKKGDILTKSVELDTAESIARTQVEKFNYKNEVSMKLLFDVLLKKRRNSDAQEVLDKFKQSLPDSQVLADCQKQFEIEVKGLKVLKYDRR